LVFLGARNGYSRWGVEWLIKLNSVNTLDGIANDTQKRRGFKVVIAKQNVEPPVLLMLDMGTQNPLDRALCCANVAERLR
jgi:hypothetical protein